MTYTAIDGDLHAGRMVIIDGGTGTDIQARGVAMDGETWCAQANYDVPDVVREVHGDYVRAGARLVVANNYPTSPLLFDHLGRSDEVGGIDALAVRLAREAVGNAPVAVAASFSVMRPALAGTDRTAPIDWDERRARALMERKAVGLAASGCDLIVMEMLRDTDYSHWATEAALATGLPVWVGISAERADDGTLLAYSRPELTLDEVVADLATLEPAVISIMHTSPNDTAEALRIVRRHWDGPLGAYPESGWFEMPDWQFVDTIATDDLVALSEEWVAIGATVLGGCCGTGPGHIAALHARWAPNGNDPQFSHTEHSPRR